MLFTYVMAGWEGTAHDSRILSDTIRNPSNRFPMPPNGKYYLVDAGYTNRRGFLAPYRNVRYWLGDYRRGSGPRNKEELFNYFHSSLRNVIERTFGVWKARFPILKKMAPYPFGIQVRIVAATMAIHNYIRMSNLTDALFERYQNTAVEDENATEQQYPIVQPDNEQAEMNATREEIANLLYSRR
ncbi:hypothetical protein QJS04_geneDACA007000 [Acorus gramineus]|uniref:DDE Tnp4 domain-containing protein n=1 Tax=Acorus gramineus TaxID=55184 RepID=A0AAV9A2K4_ACOGR|nr:hypothetical protein QJS04_geneDACA007000 [Acorus gramineus]